MSTDIERHEDGRPREWDWLLVCAKGHAAGTWTECRGALNRASEAMGAELLCEAHRPPTWTSIYDWVGVLPR